MPAKKKIITRRPRTLREEDSEMMPQLSKPEQTVDFTLPAPTGGNKKIILAALVIAILAGILFATRSWYLAAVINGKPIFRWDLNAVMTQRFGQQSLEGMISESLIEEEGKKQNIEVTATDVTQKEEEIVKNLGGGVKLEDLLKFQGITKADFDQQVKLQLLVQKILGRDIDITDKDVELYISTSSARLTATEPGALKDEARQAILDSKIGEKVQEWFTSLKDKAQIVRFVQ